jgi:hypothetical protein
MTILWNSNKIFLIISNIKFSTNNPANVCLFRILNHLNILFKFTFYQNIFSIVPSRTPYSRMHYLRFNHDITPYHLTLFQTFQLKHDVITLVSIYYINSFCSQSCLLGFFNCLGPAHLSMIYSVFYRWVGCTIL